MPRTRPRNAGLSTLLAVALVPLGLVATCAPSASAAATAATATYVYVDCSAAIEGNGSQSSPYNSLSDVNSLTLAAGDVLAFATGSTCTGTLSPGGSGSSSAPITTTDYTSADGTGLPVINGNGATAAVTLTNQNYWTVENLSLTNPAATEAQRDGILVTATDGAAHTGYTIENVTVNGVAGFTNKATNSNAFVHSSGIEFDASNTGSTLNNVLIQNDTVSNAGGGGIKVRTGALTERGNNVLVQDDTVSADGGDGIVVEYANSPLIQNDTGADLGTGEYPWTGGNFAGMWVLGDLNPTIQYNVVYGTIMSDFDSEAFDCDWGNSGTCTVQYNLTHDNAGGFFLNCDGCGTSGAPQQVVRYNIFQNDCRSISSGDAVTLWFYNNDVYCPNTAFNVNWPSTSHVMNNIFVGESTSSLPTGSGISWLWNMFEGVPRPTNNGIAGNPDLVDPGTAGNTLSSASGYELTTSSPGLDNGAVMSSNGGRDYYGNPVSSTAKPDRGAYDGPGVSG